MLIFENWCYFVFSVFYVFYEQYLTIWFETLESLGLSLFVVFIVTYLLTGRSLFSAVIVLLTVTMIIINLAGFMYWWNVSLNAVSLVNLVMVSPKIAFFSELKEEMKILLVDVSTFNFLGGWNFCGVLQSCCSLLFVFGRRYEDGKDCSDTEHHWKFRKKDEKLK